MIQYNIHVLVLHAELFLHIVYSMVINLSDIVTNSPPSTNECVFVNASPEDFS